MIEFNVNEHSTMNAVLSALERRSKWLFGATYAIPVWSRVGDMAVSDRFFTQELVRELEISPSIVKPILNRLAAIDLIDQVEAPLDAKPNP